MTEPKPRTADEIVERFRRAGDPFGWERETIIRYLTWGEARGLTSDTEAEWEAFARPRTIEAITTDAHAYADYTFGRVLAHRHNEAQRSMYKLDYWCWLLGGARLEHAPEPGDERGTYCMRAIRGALDALCYPWPPTHYRDHYDSPRMPLTPVQQAALTRMADGQPCTLMCDAGCRYTDPDAKETQTQWD